ncbi:MAG: pantetheine-phosphate adenylyltransferase [Muribaculaceae bacterium]|nr:pantetheine-phosphate adenylyltransferase [Muribaculaceae bacterium]
MYSQVPYANHDNARIALFAGSFDPFTLGHASVVERALPLFDRIVIAVGFNSSKEASESITRRTQELKRIYRHRLDKSIVIMTYEHKLTIDLARQVGANWLLRGVRNVKDFEYERELADINRRLSGIETVILFTLPEHQSLSSSLVRELRSFGHDTSSLIP